MKKTTIFLTIVFAFALILGACTTPEVAPPPEEEAPVAEEAAPAAEEAAPAEEAVEEEAVAEPEPVFDFDASVKADAEYDIAVVLKNSNNPFWLQHVDGAEAAGVDLGVNITTYAPETPSSIEEQITIIEDIITKGVDCMALAPANTESIAVAVAKLNDAGIPVVYGKLLMLEGIPGQSTSDLRTQGVKEAMEAYPNIEVEYQPAHWELSEASDITTAVLQKWPDLKAIIAAGSNMSEGAAEAAKTAGVNMDDIIIGSFDVTDQTIEALENGSVDFTIDQQPYMQAYYSVGLCVQKLNGMDVPQEVRTPVAFLTVEDLP